MTARSAPGERERSLVSRMPENAGDGKAIRDAGTSPVLRLMGNVPDAGAGSFPAEGGSWLQKAVAPCKAAETVMLPCLSERKGAGPPPCMRMPSWRAVFVAAGSVMPGSVRCSLVQRAQKRCGLQGCAVLHGSCGGAGRSGRRHCQWADMAGFFTPERAS